MTTYKGSLTQPLINRENNSEKGSGASVKPATGLEKDCSQCPKQNDCSTVKKLENVPRS